ncbi:MAG TPA: hypothetical protein VEI50_02705 [Nitrospiraceae bacterium]|nr:hypothetical protein [Nitrospiraceae bacterium]
MPTQKRQSKQTETAFSTASTFEGGRYGLRSIEGGIGDAARGIWRFFHHAPGLGGVVTGGLGAGAAMLIGVGELLVGAAVGYVGYRIYAYGESPTEALEKAIRFEEGRLSDEELMKPVPK